MPDQFSLKQASDQPEKSPRSNQLGQERLNKFLASRLGISRRAADQAIRKGEVTVNSGLAKIGEKVDKSDKICYNRKIVPWEINFVYLAFHKPKNYVCSRRRQGTTPTIYELLPARYQKLKTVGRLDADSSGLILLTNDGDFAHRLTHPAFVKLKLYAVELDRPLAPAHQQMIAEFGLELVDGHSRLELTELNGEEVEWGEEFSSGATKPRARWLVAMHEGRNRQIRRTFAAAGYTVIRLHRLTFGPYRLDGLKPGQWREILRKKS